MDDPDLAAQFATALEQVLSPIDWPRYLVSRDLPGRRARIWHAVPDGAGANRRGADRFHAAWVRCVSTSELVYTGSPEGAGVLAAVRGLNPFAMAAWSSGADHDRSRRSPLGRVEQKLPR